MSVPEFEGIVLRRGPHKQPELVITLAALDVILSNEDSIIATEDVERLLRVFPTYAEACGASKDRDIQAWTAACDAMYGERDEDEEDEEDEG